MKQFYTNLRVGSNGFLSVHQFIFFLDRYGCYRLVIDDQIAGMPVGFRDFSPSGDRIVFVSQDKLYIADQTGTVIRPILEDSGPWKYPWRLQWSPDGRLIAYTAHREVTSESGKSPVRAIFVLSPDGGAPRQIGPELTGTEHVRWVNWTPDGKHLMYRFS